MDEKSQILSNNLQIQWQDHFHMRDQTWKVLQYSILFFLGVVGLEFKEVDPIVMIPAYMAVMLTSFFGFFIALHHRRRQKEKFEIIEKLETELGISTLIKPILNNAHKTFIGRINTSCYIVLMQFCVFLVSIILIIKQILY